jgi:hypothetical protein
MPVADMENIAAHAAEEPIEPPREARTPPQEIVDLVHETLADLLEANPIATSSESYVQHHVEFAVIRADVEPRYYLRIGINYHGQKVQHVQLGDGGTLIGWNPDGDALGTADSAKLLLAGHTIFDRDEDEPMKNDTKIGGGEIPDGTYLRLEFKVRGWLGKTKNLDGAQLMKDIGLLETGAADLLVICLSETAHRKWRGEGPPHQVARRTHIEDFQPLLAQVEQLPDDGKLVQELTYREQPWTVSTQKVAAGPGCLMPGAIHVVTLVWRR